MYAGSSYGKQVLENRIFNNHKRETYRTYESERQSYQVMDSPRTKTIFIPISIFEESMPIVGVLLAEAALCVIMRTFDNPFDLSIRPQSLPQLSIFNGMNRSDPLAFPSRKDVIKGCRERALVNALARGPQNVTLHLYKTKEVEKCRFRITLSRPKSLTFKENRN